MEMKARNLSRNVTANQRGQKENLKGAQLGAKGTLPTILN